MSLIGRNKELDRILAVIRGPKESALTVVGRRGMGKSALLSEIPRLSDHRTVFLRASASESDWPLSGLTALLNGIDDPVLSRFADELLRDSTGAMDVATVATMLLNGLHQRSSSRTVVVIDDADQLDSSSQAVIGFIARRLAGTDIALFASVREEAPDSPFGSLPALRLKALNYNDTVRMLESIPAQQICDDGGPRCRRGNAGEPAGRRRALHLPAGTSCRGEIRASHSASLQRKF